MAVPWVLLTPCVLSCAVDCSTLPFESCNSSWCLNLHPPTVQALLRKQFCYVTTFETIVNKQNKRYWGFSSFLSATVLPFKMWQSCSFVMSRTQTAFLLLDRTLGVVCYNHLSQSPLNERKSSRNLSSSHDLVISQTTFHYHCFLVNKNHEVHETGFLFCCSTFAAIRNHRRLSSNGSLWTILKMFSKLFIQVGKIFQMAWGYCVGEKIPCYCVGEKHPLLLYRWKTSLDTV